MEPAPTATHRIHIFGASGSGTTTLGALLADAVSCSHYDTDTYFWIKTNPPFRSIRALVERQELLRRDLNREDSWILSGSLCGWGDFAIPLFDLAVYLVVPADIRVRRLKEREIRRYGPEINDPLDTRYETHQKFIAWAGAYDRGGPEMRSRIRHETWIKELPCTVLRIEGSEPPERNLKRILDHGSLPSILSK